MNAPSPKTRGGHDLARRSAATTAALPPGSAAVKPVTSLLAPVGSGVAGTIVGLDLSLSATGIAWMRGEDIRTRHLKTGLTGHERMDFILGEIAMAVCNADVVAVEGPSYGSGAKGRQSGHHERAGLWWLVTHLVLRGAVPFAVVPPASCKKYATGKGNAGKADMLIAAVRRLPAVDVKDDNEADALWLAAMAADRYGCPLVTMPQANRAAVEAVEWPDLAALAGMGSAP